MKLAVFSKMADAMALARFSPGDFQGGWTCSCFWTWRTVLELARCADCRLIHWLYNDPGATTWTNSYCNLQLYKEKSAFCENRFGMKIAKINVREYDHSQIHEI